MANKTTTIHRFANESYIVECGDEEDDQNSSAYNDVFVDDQNTDDDGNNDEFDDAQEDVAQSIENDDRSHVRVPMCNVNQMRNTACTYDQKFGVINKGLLSAILLLSIFRSLIG